MNQLGLDDDLLNLYDDESVGYEVEPRIVSLQIF